ncbi:MAG: sigma-70 family RNA polymerase sigma factor [Bacteroidetes bacterium]|nr:MAG: sigma-70 family RNA polymerase sigma factor [Bacteroidota bacterium]
MNINTLTSVEIENEVKDILSAQENIAHFEVLYERYFSKIYLFIYHKINEKETSADITANVFLKAIENIQNYKPQGLPFSAWLYRIATNEVFQFFKKSKNQRFILIDEHFIDTMIEESKLLELEEIYTQLEKLITTLDYEEVDLIELRFKEKKSFKEIAFIKNKSETACRTQIWRILEKLRILLK